MPYSLSVTTQSARVGVLRHDAREGESLPVYQDGERELVKKVADFVTKQAALFLKLAPMVPKVDRALL